MPKSPVQTKSVQSEVPVKFKKEKKTIQNQQTPINEGKQTKTSPRVDLMKKKLLLFTVSDVTIGARVY